MKLTYMIAALALVLGSACKKNDANKDKAPTTEPAANGEGAPKTAEPAPAKAAKGRSIPNSNKELVVDAPAKWLDNGFGGAAGMHLDAEAGNFMLDATTPEEAGKPFAQYKKETEEIMFQKWISAEETPDGFKTVYVLDKISMKGEEMVKDGSVLAFRVRRKIGGKTWDCSGSGATEELVAEAIALCLKVDAS